MKDFMQSLHIPRIANQHHYISFLQSTENDKAMTTFLCSHGFTREEIIVHQVFFGERIQKLVVLEFNDDGLSTYAKKGRSYLSNLQRYNSKIVSFALEECRRQHDNTVKAVTNLAIAWLLCNYNKITVDFILALGYLVKGNRGYRKVPASFRNGNHGLPSELIERQLDKLCENISSLTPDEFYREFEEIHPFVDGNGRIGALLWNMLQSNSDPITPPKLFN